MGVARQAPDAPTSCLMLELKAGRGEGEDELDKRSVVCPRIVSTDLNDLICKTRLIITSRSTSPRIIGSRCQV